jgi:hypothetical protein
VTRSRDTSRGCLGIPSLVEMKATRNCGHIFAIAYRMLGSVAEAEDVVQDERGCTYRPARVNGEPGLVFYDEEGGALWVAALEIADGVVVAVRSVLNPDKLAHVPAREP